MIKPFPKEISSIIKTSKKTVCVEQNFSGQLRSYIASETGIIIENQILKYNGRPMRYDEVSEGLDKIMEGERKVVLNAY